MTLQRGFHWLVFAGSLIAAAVWTDSASAQPRRVKAKGQVVAVVSGQVTMVDEQKGVLTLKPKAESPLIEIGGPWKLEEIKPGLLVRLAGTVKSNSLTEEVTELTLHSPADGYQVGVQQDAEDQPATIVGQFVRIKDRVLTVAVGKRRINARLAKEAVALVDSKDLRFVRRGDAIEIDSYTTSSGTLSARTIKVTLKPLKPPEGKEPEKSDAQESD